MFSWLPYQRRSGCVGGLVSACKVCLEPHFHVRRNDLIVFVLEYEALSTHELAIQYADEKNCLALYH
jgi:hypothetical protein